MNIAQPSTNVIVQPSKVSSQFSVDDIKFTPWCCNQPCELNNQCSERKGQCFENKKLFVSLRFLNILSDSALKPIPVWIPAGLFLHGPCRTISTGVMLTGAEGPGRASVPKCATTIHHTGFKPELRQQHPKSSADPLTVVTFTL